MNKKEKILIFILNAFFCLASILFTALLMDGWGVFISIFCYALPSVCFIVGLVAFALDKQAILKSCFVIMVCVFIIIGAISAVSQAAHLGDYKTDSERIDRLVDIILGTGKWGMVVYVFIQILQVVILPLPAVVCYIPGSRIWGAGIATLLASAGVLLGSVIAYCIGRFFGKKAVVWIAGKDTTEKYIDYIGNKGKMIFVLMQILPFFPDDILCMIAGLTSMSFPFFLAVMILVRPLVIAAYCYLGNGSLIPFSGWGIPVWIAIFAVCIVLAVLSFKYQDRVEKWLVSKFGKKKDEPKEEAPEEENNKEE